MKMTEVKWKLRNIKTNEVIDIDKPIFKVGRRLDADLKTELCEVSRNHATLSILVGDLLYVHDNKSCNGTFINQRKIEPMENVLLNHGDIIGFGMNSQMIENSPTIPLIFEVGREVSISIAHTGFSVNNPKVIEISDSFDEIQVNCSEKGDVVEEELVEPDVDTANKKNVELGVDMENVGEGGIVDTNVEMPVETHQKISQKMSPTEDKVGTDLQYSVNDEDDCIVISDGEDDEPFAQSQIFVMSEKIKLEQTSYHDSIDPYFEIKQELKDLECDGENQIPVDLTEDIDHFETTSELLNILDTSDSPEEERDITPTTFSRRELKVLLEKDLVQERKEEKNCIRTPDDVLIPISSKKQADAAHSAVTAKDEKRSYKKKQNQVNPPDVVVDELLCKESPRSRQRRKTMTLQVIPPLNVKPNVSNEKRESPSKRKSSNIPFESKKKLKTTKADKTAGQTCGQMTVQEKKEIALARRQKLRDIAIKQSAESNVKEKSPKVAVSSVRPEQSTSTGVIGDPRRCRQEYEAVMSPLILLELWELIHHTAYSKEDERRPLTVSVTHVRKMDQVAFLDCQVNMQETDANSNMFRPEDFCLIELKGTDRDRKIQQTTKFGYIEHVNRTHQGGVSCVRFTLLTSKFNITLLGSSVLVKVIVNVSSSLRLFKTIKCLASSPLCRYVLKPNTIRAPYGISSENIVLNTTCNLNREQKDIVAEASELCLRKSAGIYLMKGPPGTGKSTVIANIICNVLSKSIASGEPALILLTAPSNAAVDGLLLKLNDYRSSLIEEEKKNIKLVRVGPDSSISEKVGNFKSRVLARNHILVDKGLVSLEDYAVYSRNKWNLEQFLRRHLGQRFTYEMNNAEDLVLYKSNVICTTLNSCVGYKITQLVRKGLMKFTCCIIDEATQCNEVESLIPIQLGIDKFVLVGDPQQLPAVVCNKDAQKMGYGNSLFSRVVDNFKNRSWCPIKTLTNQYRMKSEICEFPNRAYYGGKLISCPVFSNPIQPAVKPYMVFNLTRAESRDYSDYVNTDESHLICTLLSTLKACLNSTSKYTIGVITPYKAQKELLLRDISNIRMPPEVSVTVNTVDSFQGMENDVIIISCVRYTTNYFLQSDQRLNVALTRAKQALYIIGNYTLFKKCRPLYDLREDAKRRKCLFDIHEDPRKMSSLRRFIMER